MRRILVIGGCLLAAVATDRAADRAAPPAAIRADLEARLSEAAANGFSGTALASRGGEVFLERSYGMADRAKGRANSSRTMFDVGSISKSFTKAAVIALAEQGRLKLDDPIAAHLDGVPRDKASITLAQVIDHAAGLHEYHDTEGDFEPMDRAEALRRILGQELLFEPGTERAYSNSGYTLLAALVEEVSGDSFQDYVRRRLLQPAGMRRTGWYRNPGWKPEQVAIGYDSGSFGEVNSPYHWPEIGWALLGNGGMVSNPAELHRWIEALRSGKILNPESLERFDNLDVDGEEDPHLIAYAGGNDFGFVAIVVEDLRHGDHLIVTTNAGGGVIEEAIRELTPLMFDADPFAGAEVDTEQGDAPPPAGDWGLPASPTGKRASQMLDAIRDGSEQAAREFIADAFHPSWFEESSEDEIVGVFREIQQSLADPRLEGARRSGPGRAELRVRPAAAGESVRIRMELETAPPHRIVGLDVGPDDG